MRWALPSCNHVHYHHLQLKFDLNGANPGVDPQTYTADLGSGFGT